MQEQEDDAFRFAAAVRDCTGLDAQLGRSETCAHTGEQAGLQKSAPIKGVKATHRALHNCRETPLEVAHVDRWANARCLASAHMHMLPLLLRAVKGDWDLEAAMRKTERGRGKSATSHRTPT
ncbi:MAG TPA: hypothetical protein VHB77_04775 [Planctomycetaceae bacterium]|nr:hypothetical protein [Planctomycetaceae bacterium]